MSDARALASEADQVLDVSPSRRQKGRFTVVCPVYNRRRTLPQALDSLLTQSYEDWLCLILDDGSTDGTPLVGRNYARKDPRFLYVRFEENRGGVAMNEIGMQVACELGEYWSRLGSDDWFEPHKLMVDYVTLGRNDLPACFGPYRCTRGYAFDRVLSTLRAGALRMPGRVAATWADAAIRSDAVRQLRQKFSTPHARLQGPPVDARSDLLSGRFAMSWANVAVRTGVLRKVRDRFGGFCDLRIRNMEDFHCNVRIASVSNIVWRGLKQDRRTVVVGARTWAEAGGQGDFVHDGMWRMAADGASSQSDQFAFDRSLTLAAIQADIASHPPKPCPTIRPCVVRL